MNMLYEVGTFLTTSRTGFDSIGTLGTDVFLTNHPDTTGNCITLIQYSGPAETEVFGVYIDQPHLQITTITSTTHADLGYAKAFVVQNRLRQITNSYVPTTTGSWYLKISPIQSAPTWIGKDALGRGQWVQNFAVQLSY